MLHKHQQHKVEHRRHQSETHPVGKRRRKPLRLSPERKDARAQKDEKQDDRPRGQRPQQREPQRRPPPVPPSAEKRPQQKERERQSIPREEGRAGHPVAHSSPPSESAR